MLMGIHKLKEIAEIFRNEGKGRLPVAVIQNGSAKNEKVVVGIVDTITELAEEKRITSPALIIFGDVVSLHPQFNAIREFYELAAGE